MSEPAFYRYFLAFLPDPLLRLQLETLYAIGGQYAGRVRPDRLHLTLCVLAETRLRDRFIAARILAALAARRLWSPPFWLGRVRGGARGAVIRAMGRQGELQDFYRYLIACLAERGLHPRYRRSGLHPHVTLGHQPCAFSPFSRPLEWVPGELVLIESEVGRTVHNILARWPLLTPRQGFFDFGPSSAGIRSAA